MATDTSATAQGIGYHVTAERYLFKQLSKIKRVAESPAFKEFQESKNVLTQGPRSTAEANVLARLFKSNPVKNVLPGILGDIRKLLGLEEAPAPKQSKPGDRKDGAAKAKAVRLQNEDSDIELEGEQRAKWSAKKQDGERDAGVEDLGISGNEGSESEDFSKFDSRLAPGSDSEDLDGEDDEEGSDDKALADAISDSVSRSPSPAFSAEASPPSKKPKGSKASAAPVQSTTFLPSLMMGGYWSGSEEGSEDEEAAGPPKRKNRMGQQARRALWEKKYGAKANHVQQEKKQQKRNRDSGWDTRRGATDAGRERESKHGARGGFGADGGRSQNRRDDRAGRDQAGKPKGPLKDTGPLHPSWEAKRKLKEQASTAAFQGKKVVFD